MKRRRCKSIPSLPSKPCAGTAPPSRPRPSRAELQVTQARTGPCSFFTLAYFKIWIPRPRAHEKWSSRPHVEPGNLYFQKVAQRLSRAGRSRTHFTVSPWAHPAALHPSIKDRILSRGQESLTVTPRRLKASLPSLNAAKPAMAAAPPGTASCLLGAKGPQQGLCETTQQREDGALGGRG